MQEHETSGAIIRFYTSLGNAIEVYIKPNESGKKVEEVYEKLIKEVNDERTQQADTGRKGFKAFKRLRQHFQLRRDKRIRDNAAGEQDFGVEKARH